MIRYFVKIKDKTLLFLSVIILSYELSVFSCILHRLYIKQATSATSVADEEEEEAEWVEYKIKETNMFTVDKYQQVRVVMLSQS